MIFDIEEALNDQRIVELISGSAASSPVASDEIEEEPMVPFSVAKSCLNQLLRFVRQHPRSYQWALLKKQMKRISATSSPVLTKQK
jgi:hypothetical protein